MVRNQTAELAIYVRNGDAQFLVSGVYLLPQDPLTVQTADLNGDTIPDFVIPGGGEDTVSVLLSFP